MMWTAPPWGHLVPKGGRWSATKREAVHAEIYPNWRRHRQEFLSSPRAGERRLFRHETQTEPFRDRQIPRRRRAVRDRHGGLRLGALLGAAVSRDLCESHRREQGEPMPGFTLVHSGL